MAIFITRRQWLGIAGASTWSLGTPVHSEPSPHDESLSLHAWVRDQRNPIFVPKSTFDVKGAQGPCVVSHDGQWWMFYAGLSTDGSQRICLATAPADNPSEWERLGPVFDLGGKGAFDERSCTYPYVHRICGKWHLYYSGGSTRGGPQHFSNYWGIGLAQSDDLRTWKKYAAEPVLLGTGVKEYAHNQALVGLGNILELTQSDGRTMYRLHYTLLPGLRDPEWKANGTWHMIEHKVCAAAHSIDGIDWTDRQVVLDRRRDVPSEDIGVVGLHVWRTGSRYRAIYTALGTKYGTYALAEAVSVDGLTWRRGLPGENISLAPRLGTWESGMIGYPSVLRERDSIRLFYNGAGAGATGVGMAVARMLD